MIEPIEASKFANRDLSIFDQNLVLPRHRWYEFKEGFSEGLVREAIQDVTHGRERSLKLLDPFSGSGTTLVAAGRLGHHAVGIELNPFLAFAARAKCSPKIANENEALELIEAALKGSDDLRQSPLEGQSTFTYRPGAQKWLFNRGVIRCFHALDAALVEAGGCRDPLRLALFASLIECCNAKRDGKCFRYRNGWKKLRRDANDLRKSFARQAAVVARDLVEAEFDSTSTQIIQGDARVALGELPKEEFDLTVTSPPYLNSFDYSDVYRPELFAGGFVKTNAELRQIRLKTIHSHVQVKWEPANKVSSALLRPLLLELSRRELWNPHIPNMVQSYFTDMAIVLRGMANATKVGGQAWIVVSTSAYAGLEIPVDLILADVATQNGWHLLGVNVLRQLRSAGQHWVHVGEATRMPLRESLVILRRP